MKGIIGRKVGMTQVFDESGQVIPVTVIEAGPCYVTQVRTAERDGYMAVQLGFDATKEKRLTNGQLGHLKRTGSPPLRHLREFRVKETDVEEGQEITVAIFETGELVDVVGISKGRGFAGEIKRHGHKRQPKTHGQSDRERAHGSVGATSTPGRVFKGMKMAGRMGNQRVTSQNLEVVVIDPERNLLAVRGSVPGAKGGIVMVKRARKQKVKKGA
jgi:large subunit ribosomal protein L3